MKTRYEILEEHWMRHHYRDLWEWAGKEIDMKSKELDKENRKNNLKIEYAIDCLRSFLHGNQFDDKIRLTNLAIAERYIREVREDFKND